jgi:hypothetical protein
VVVVVEVVALARLLGLLAAAWGHSNLRNQARNSNDWHGQGNEGMPRSMQGDLHAHALGALQ